MSGRRHQSQIKLLHSDSPSNFPHAPLSYIKPFFSPKIIKVALSLVMKLKQLHQVFNQLICESHTCSCADRRSRSALELHGGAAEHLELSELNKYILMHGGSQHCFLTFTLTVNPEPSCSETLLFFFFSRKRQSSPKLLEQNDEVAWKCF